MSESGLELVEYNVAILPDAVEQVSPGGIIIVTSERNEWEVQEGTLDALSPHAFSYAEWPADARIPEVGDRVLFAKYAGSLIERNGRKVRICKDKDIIAVVQRASVPLAAAA